MVGGVISAYYSTADGYRDNTRHRALFKPLYGLYMPCMFTE